MAKGPGGQRPVGGQGGPGGKGGGKPPFRPRNDENAPPREGGDGPRREWRDDDRQETRGPRPFGQGGPPRGPRTPDSEGGDGPNERRGGFQRRDDGPPERRGGFQRRDDGPPGQRQGGPGGFGGGQRPSGPRQGGPGGFRPSGPGGPRPFGPRRDEGGDDQGQPSMLPPRPPRVQMRSNLPRVSGPDGPGRPPFRSGPGRDRDDERPGPTRRAADVGEVLYGRNAVLGALRAGRSIRRVLVATGAHGEVITEIVDEARARKISLQSVDRRRLDDMAFNHQGVVAEAAPFTYATIEDVIAAAKASPNPLVLVLDVLQDPQNLGSLMRTAAAAGAQGIVIPEHRAVGVTPAVVKASAGAIEHLKIAQVTNLSRAIDALKEVGLWAVGLDAGATDRYDRADLNRPMALVVGGEGKGLRPLVRQHCDMVVSLPMPGQIESLNAAVAGSIVLYEALRQRGDAPPVTVGAPAVEAEVAGDDVDADADDEIIPVEDGELEAAIDALGLASEVSGPERD